MVMVSFHLNRIVTKTVGKELQGAAHTESAAKMQDLWRLSLGAPANSSPKCWESLCEMPSGCICMRQFRRSWGIRCSYGLLGLFLRGGAWCRWLGCDIAFRKGTVVLVGAWLVLGVNCDEIVMKQWAWHSRFSGFLSHYVLALAGCAIGTSWYRAGSTLIGQTK